MNTLCKSLMVLLVVGLVTALGVSVAEASIATQYLSTNSNEVSELEDFDFETAIVDGDGDAATIGTGDVLLGIWEAEKIFAVKGGGSFTPDPLDGDVNFTGLFAIEVKKTTEIKDGSGTVISYEWEFGAVSDWGALQTTYSSLPTPDGYTSGDGNQTMLFVYSDDNPDSDSWIEALEAGNTGFPDVNSSLDSVTDGDLLWEFGDTGGDAVAGGFWDASGPTNLIGSLSSAKSVTYIAGLETLFTSALGLELIDHDSQDFFTDAPDYNGPYGLELVGATSDKVNDEGWLPTSTRLFVNAVPEPGSVVVWAAGLLMAIGFGARRVRRNKR